MKHIVLAGGNGTRLWPFSRSSCPKQFLSFGDQYSLLQRTVLRILSRADVKDILIVTHQDFLHITRAQLRELRPSLDQQILVEPERKNTAPAICYAIKFFLDILGVSKEESVLVSSADHVISPESAFFSVVQEGEAISQEGYNVLFGIRPNKPEIGYGYVKISSPVKKGFYTVDRFVEKPDYSSAQSFLLSGQYLWNAGIFLFHIKTFLDEISLYCSELHQLMEGSFHDMHAGFSRFSNISIDYALLEKTKNLLVAPLDVVWSDVGSWDSIYDLLDKDLNRNVKSGNVLDIDTENCLIMGSERLISTVGLKDLIIVDTEDALFVGKKGASQSVKVLVEEMRKRNINEPSGHAVLKEKNGDIENLNISERAKIVSLTIQPHCQQEVNFHSAVADHWIVIRGSAVIVAHDGETLYRQGERFILDNIPSFCIKNCGLVPLEIVRISVTAVDPSREMALEQLTCQLQ